MKYYVAIKWGYLKIAERIWEWIFKESYRVNKEIGKNELANLNAPEIWKTELSKKK